MADNCSDDRQLAFLHGDLDLHIIEARRLPNLDIISKNLRRCLTLCDARPAFSSFKTTTSTRYQRHSRRREDRKLHHHRHGITSDPYVTVVVPQATLARTCVIKNAKNPKWKQRFVIPLAHPVTELEFRIKDHDPFGSELIGTAKIPADEIASGKELSGWFSINDSSGKPPKPDTAIRLEMKFTPFEENPVYGYGAVGSPEQGGVRGTYFPVRRGSHVTTYQDAHVRPDELSPEIELDGGKVYRQEKCWEDICHALCEAHHMIYIAGWSVFHKIRLIREPTRPLPRGGDLTLGELLKYKSEEGVRVLLLIWDDRTSDKHGIKKEGLMKTHDEETRKFFKHSDVVCVLTPRYASSKLNYFKQQIVGTIFTHHQKCVLVDTQASGNDRKITAFLGGLDLCDGRYDTPEHQLFRHLDNEFKDFHNPTFPTGTKAPREPWHDMHCRIEGPAAYDVLINFQQRWRKEARRKEFKLRKGISHWHYNSLLKIERISWILSPPFFESKDGTALVPGDDPTVHVSSEDDPEHWHVQIFRSIDSGSVKGFPDNVDQCQAQNLIVAKTIVVDRSIQTAYIQAIRSAQHFIYIENQYFIGSSYAWPSYKGAGADNLIPMELALKIASKIRANERFAVYVVIPMWPEGDPNSTSLQEILFWQSQTMEMMYDIIAKELNSKHLVVSHPLDYLNFYCLGKRERTCDTNGDQVSAAVKFQRFMIYVHAKGMIVDDEYVILGSANINQRSMAGTKDSEIAMGAYQPHHTWATKKKHPRGQVYGYRMSLWAEHLGAIDSLFMEPNRLECVKMVNSIAEDNWKRYTDQDFTPLQGHLLRYPVQVDANGKVSPLPGFEKFPDIGGSVLGAHSATVPDTLTT